jgi:molybdopterin-guanine dinucleotide biosynthesis protein A
MVVARDAAQSASYRLPDARIIVDLIPDTGPLMGLYSGLLATMTSHAFVVAVDMPFVSPSVISFLLSPPLTDVVRVPLIDGVPQVLLALYPRSILPLVEQRLREGRRDPRALLALTPVHFIEEAQLRLVDPQLRSFINVNTLNELEGV